VLSAHDYQAMLAVAGSIDWRARVALVLAWETGHRINAILRLRWSDVASSFDKLRWRGENDKLRYEHETPTSSVAAEVLRFAQNRTLGVGEAWVFPSSQEAVQPCSYDQARHWWRRIEGVLGVEHAKRMGWHSVRRRFGTDHKHLPVPDLRQLGGWKSDGAVFKCYAMADDQTMREALESRSKKYAKVNELAHELTQLTSSKGEV
jgi:integrase